MWSQPASHGSVAVSGRAHRVERGPQARGPGAGDQAPPHLLRHPPSCPGRRVKSQRVGNPSVSRDAAASALKVPRRIGPGRKGPGSTGLGGRTQDRSRPRGTRNAAVGSSQSSAGISGYFFTDATFPGKTNRNICVTGTTQVRSSLPLQFKAFDSFAVTLCSFGSG
ncbi:hypothetical protein NDU88_008239 [Pleurodeles waltl]|uniref:Uncharacterized protein n=1 Tax=Pleurodeles waltl TaxID=8319 RepID=A0AAV7NCI4_PLEWA|nr:hypothetical protein NDU88_008239 [Pleurodeles waltl]